MRLLLSALAVSACVPALAAGPAQATGDPLASAQCRTARAELDRLLADPRLRQGEPLERARRRTADACLGQASATPSRSGAPVPPQAARLPAITPPPAPALPQIAPPQGPLAIARPTVITTCDLAGCWDSQGRRLNQTGPLLVGPSGVCNVQGGLVTCP